MYNSNMNSGNRQSKSLQVKRIIACSLTYEFPGLGLYLPQQSLRVGQGLLLIAGVALQEAPVLWV